MKPKTVTMGHDPTRRCGRELRHPGKGVTGEERPCKNTDEADRLRYRQHGEHSHATRRASTEEVADAPAESAGQRKDGRHQKRGTAAA